MPTYLYEHCGERFEVVKSMRESSSAELCPRCMVQAERIFTVPQLSPTAKPFEAHFNYGLGKKIHNKREIKEHLAQVKGETGRTIVEVGTDGMTSVKPSRKNYDLPEGAVDGIKASFGL
jgi:putative FmdB family regulatory protein